jgi:hypothetical protein
MAIVAHIVTAGRATRGAARGVVVALCLAAVGCSTFERQVMAPPNPNNPMSEPPPGLTDPCAGLSPAQRAATQGCGAP